MTCKVSSGSKCRVWRRSVKSVRCGVQSGQCRGKVQLRHRSGPFEKVTAVSGKNAGPQVDVRNMTIELGQVPYSVNCEKSKVVGPNVQCKV